MKTAVSTQSLVEMARLCETLSCISHFEQIEAVCVLLHTHRACSCAATSEVSPIPSSRNMIVFGLACEMKPVRGVGAGGWHIN